MENTKKTFKFHQVPTPINLMGEEHTTATTASSPMAGEATPQQPRVPLALDLTGAVDVSPSPSPSPSSTDLAASKKRKARGPYKCGICGKPKKGHVCEHALHIDPRLLPGMLVNLPQLQSYNNANNSAGTNNNTANNGTNTVPSTPNIGTPSADNHAAASATSPLTSPTLPSEISPILPPQLPMRTVPLPNNFNELIAGAKHIYSVPVNTQVTLVVPIAPVENGSAVACVDLPAEQCTHWLTIMRDSPTTELWGYLPHILQRLRRFLEEQSAMSQNGEGSAFSIEILGNFLLQWARTVNLLSVVMSQEACNYLFEYDLLAPTKDAQQASLPSMSVRGTALFADMLCTLLERIVNELSDEPRRQAFRRLVAFGANEALLAHCGGVIGPYVTRLAMSPDASLHGLFHDPSVEGMHCLALLYKHQFNHRAAEIIAAAPPALWSAQSAAAVTAVLQHFVLPVLSDESSSFRALVIKTLQRLAASSRHRDLVSQSLQERIGVPLEALVDLTMALEVEDSELDNECSSPTTADDPAPLSAFPSEDSDTPPNSLRLTDMVLPVPGLSLNTAPLQQQQQFLPQLNLPGFTTQPLSFSVAPMQDGSNTNSVVGQFDFSSDDAPEDEVSKWLLGYDDDDESIDSSPVCDNSPSSIGELTGGKRKRDEDFVAHETAKRLCVY